jgi:hypothetical protein
MGTDEDHKRAEDQRLEVLIDALGDPDPATARPCASSTARYSTWPSSRPPAS